ncbi:MAG: response regulator [Alphaproteobacteria bacterium]
MTEPDRPAGPPDQAVAGDFLAGGGDLGARMRAHDWTASGLGPPSDWPQALKLSVRIMLNSRQPIWIGWGEALTYLYNDPYKSIIGGKHPWALGRPTREVWREIWSDIGPMLETATAGGQGTYVEAQLLIMERNGYPEETYYTFSYSPIPDDRGRVGGIICANTDDTQRVIGERQLALLRVLAAETADARTGEAACERSAAALASNPRDLPFALIYLAEPDGGGLALAGIVGIDRNHPAAPARIDLDGSEPWPVAEAFSGHGPRLVPDLSARFDRLPSGFWPRPPSQAVVLPLEATGESGRAGALIVGLNPFRLFDEGYRGFLGLVAGQIAAAIANAQAYAEERRRAEALAAIDRAKTAFFSNVSHEFRTPLTLMLGPLEDALASAIAGRLPADDRDRIEVAHRNSLRLLKLVNSLLDFSRIEAGRVAARIEPTEIGMLTADLASNFRSTMERAGLVLTIDSPPLPWPVPVDREMWEKIVLNLLSNAFKFTFEGEVLVRLAASADRESVVLTVRDTGVGIPAHELPRLFERFHRVEGQRSRSFEGSGIGLALVQELVRLLGGRIAVESEVGRGTAFTVELPCEASLPAGEAAADPVWVSTALRAEAYVEEARRWLPEAGGPGPEDIDRGDDLALPAAIVTAPKASSARILVADDNADMRGYLRRLLGQRWEVEVARDGHDALRAIRARRPDLVLTDVMMPGLDGIGLVRALRADAALRDLPVILLSARAGEEARVEGLDSGADDYLTKPFAARELIARVNANLELAALRRDATRELRESEARFRNMADNAPVMMWVTDAAGRCTYLNRLWHEFTGQGREEGLGFGWLDATHPEDRAEAERIFLAANAARTAFRAEYRLRRADGIYRWALDAATPRIGDDGRFHGYIGSVIDIGDRKEAEAVLQRANDLLEQRVAVAIAERAETEAQLRQSQKMEALGKLTGGVAHDFNNVLQVIGGNLHMIGREVIGHARAEQRLQTALAGVSRGSRIASQLLAFARRQPLAPKVVNLGRLLRSLDDMLRRALGEAIDLETVIAGGLWNTFVDVVQVENALLNLAINARDAMEGRGTLTIEAGNASLDADYAARHGEVVPGQYVMLAVTDAGCGMTPEIVEQVFEPFFTTKPEGQGTGLGLSMVYGFVKQSGGHIKIYSEVGHGTTVRLYLPRSHEAEDVAVAVDSGPTIGGSETVLVVEDDEEVRSTVVEMLSDLGYRVLKAKDALAALSIVDSGIPIDLLFTDVVMPGPMRSTDLARKARERIPDVAVLFTSGYTENAIVHGGRLDEGIDLLSKPYTQEALARRIRQALQGRGERAVAAGRAAAPPSPEGGAMKPLRVLVVDDEALILDSAAEMLEELGHTALRAPDAPGALVMLEEHPVDVLLTDVALPGRSGIELAVEAARRRPDLRVVFSSGYDLALPVRELPPGTRAAALRKPYNLAGLERVLAGMVDRPG